MALKFSTGLKNQLFGAIKGAVTTTASLEHGVIYIYSGSQPATADAAATGTLLMIATVGSGAFAHGTATNGLDFAAPAAGVMTKDTGEVWSGVGLAAAGTGTTAGWFRHSGNPADNQGISTTLPRIDGRISTSGAEMSLSNMTIVSGASNTVDTYQLSWPASL
jgi:hypothetical protein